jgi:murein L,D-transpeptidase YafK
MTNEEKLLPQTLVKLKSKVEKNLQVLFAKAGAIYPPEKISLIIYKHEKTVELWALKEKIWKKITEYPMTGFSGMLGPKLQEGDCQIPEGVYVMETLNPKSKFYLSIRINYPNAFDLERAKEDGRTHSGNDIYIHGKNQTSGCIPVGDEAIEEIFYLAGAFGKGEVILSPSKSENEIPDIKMHWYEKLTNQIQSAIAKYNPNA